jgi:hypothetical protein
MIRLRSVSTAPQSYPPQLLGDGQKPALQRKLDAIREYVWLCAADELEPTAILDIIDGDPADD